jgi:hypothetical protein
MGTDRRAGRLGEIDGEGQELVGGDRVLLFQAFYFRLSR